MPELIHYHIKGSGRPLVLIHGWAMHTGVWQGFSDQMAEYCMTIEVDLRGHGASKTMPGPHTFEQYARDLIALLEHLKLRDAALLGWSMGASIILKMYELGYRTTGSLVLVGANPSLVQRDDYKSGLAPVVIKRLFRQLQRDYESGLCTFLNLLCTPQEHERFSANAAYQSVMDAAACPDPEVALSTLTCLQSEDLRPATAKINAPTLIVHGERDEICLSTGGHFLADSIPGARMLMLPDTGHMSFITRRERVVKAVLAFLADNQKQAKQES